MLASCLLNTQPNFGLNSKGDFASYYCLFVDYFPVALSSHHDPIFKVLDAFEDKKKDWNKISSKRGRHKIRVLSSVKNVICARPLKYKLKPY